MIEFDALLVGGWRRYLESALFEPLVENRQPVAIPEEDLDSIAAAVEKEKEVAREWILLEDLFGPAHQAVETVAHVRGRGAEKDPHL